MPAFRRHRAAERTTPDDNTIVEQYKHDVVEAAIDLMDLPMDRDAQQRIIEILLHKAPAAEKAMARLHRDSSVTRPDSPVARL